jgi:hypothetical protein
MGKINLMAQVVEQLELYQQMKNQSCSKPILVNYKHFICVTQKSSASEVLEAGTRVSIVLNI